MNHECLNAESLIPHLRGAVDHLLDSGQLIPCRLDVERRAFASTALNHRAFDPAGVRLAFETNSAWLEVDVEPAVNIVPAEPYQHCTFDWIIDGEIVHRETHGFRPVTLRVEELGSGLKQIEIYLHQVGPIGLKSLRYAKGASVGAPVDARPRWIFYGSSITQCGMAAGPAETWPAIVSRKLNVNHMNLGYGGNCKIEPMMARMIRDIGAETIVLSLGINIQNGLDYSYYSFVSNVIGFIQSIRDVCPEIPIVCLSPLYSESREEEQEAPGLSLKEVRKHMCHAMQVLTRLGDNNLIYVDGLSLLSALDTKYLSDGLHPDACGYRLIAQRFIDWVFPLVHAKAKTTR